MQKLLRLVLLTTIVLASYSISWCQNDNVTIPSKGELTAPTDSILISFDDLRKANAKMVELKYEKEINDSLRSIVANDDKIIGEYKRNVDALKKQIVQERRKSKIACWGAGIITLSLAVAIIAK